MRFAPCFEIVCGALSKQAIEKLAVQMRFLTETHLDNPRQTGVRLSKLQDHFSELLLLEAIVSEFKGHAVKLDLARSACRRQPANGERRLGLHQDFVALGGDVKKAEAGAVVWLPLHDITDDMPAIEVCPIDPGRFLYHVLDEGCYSVVGKEPEDLPLLTISRMFAGDAFVMSPRTLHATSHKSWHTQERLSLDLRFLP